MALHISCLLWRGFHHLKISYARWNFWLRPIARELASPWKIQRGGFESGLLLHICYMRPSTHLAILPLLTPILPQASIDECPWRCKCSHLRGATLSRKGGHSACQWPCGLMDKALVFGTKDCRFESCQGQFSPRASFRSRWVARLHCGGSADGNASSFSPHGIPFNTSGTSSCVCKSI